MVIEDSCWPTFPGLIEGAHSGVGLGHEFLRHVDRTRVLVHLVEPFPTDGNDPLTNYRVIRKELELYSPALAQKPEVIAVSKSELTGSDEVQRRMSEELGMLVLSISAVTGQGLSQLVCQVLTKLDEIRDADKQAMLVDAMPGKARPWALPVPSESVVE